MRRMIASAVLAAAVAAVPFFTPRVFAEPAPAAQPATKQAEVPVRVVVLFSSGVGYFEHTGNVNGSGTTELRFKTKQINDVLKSLVLEDAGGGKVTGVTYPSQDPVDRTLKSFQVDVTGNPSLGDLLSQLRGAKVKVNHDAQSEEGTILGLEKREESTGKDDKPVERWVLNLITDGNIRQFKLESLSNIELEDPTLKQELSRALTALAQSRDQDKKPVDIAFTGDGERMMRIGYVVETPIWKTSYRLILDDAAKDKKASIQGWAIVENQTDNDWDNVQLSLVSGRPISFIEDLYQPLYIPRPIVVPELFASLAPQTYGAGLEAEKQVEEFANPVPAATGGGGGIGGGGSFGAGRSAERHVMAKAMMDRASSQPMDATKSVSSVASAAKLGELFQYTVGSVTLPRQRSAMIPIITDPLDVQPLSIYNASVLMTNPLTGARVKNTTGKHLLSGPVTVLRGGTYAGDASLDNVPPGQERLLSFGVDLDIRVDATKNNTDSNIVTGQINKGILTVERRAVMTQEYHAENKGDKDKSLLIEHPLHTGWKLIDTQKPIETTETLYRFQGSIAAGKGTKLVVKEEQVQSQTIEILQDDVNDVQFYSTVGEMPKKVRDALAKAVELKRGLIDAQRLTEDRNTQVQKISQEQQRIRDNMKSVAQNTDYYNRLLKKLNDQETKIEALQREQQDYREKSDDARKALEDYLSHLDVG